MHDPRLARLSMAVQLASLILLVACAGIESAPRPSHELEDTEALASDGLAAEPLGLDVNGEAAREAAPASRLARLPAEPGLCRTD